MRDSERDRDMAFTIVNMLKARRVNSGDSERREQISFRIYKQRQEGFQQIDDSER